ncbi:hypothetical protein PHMEG_00011508 [Phytophthora megakarya]|uniref:Uncharacterized protein n=1 Tax=Phytophthora megakarya TaxID=4795 RepID=A0A225WB27_9STRA|nr:hypothetical protein PHMEG_00011508 [Phytophthora megakarya]
MIGPAGKTPRHTLPEHEKRLWLEAMLSDRHERRLRRAERKGTTGEANEKKKIRKKAMKLTTVAMKIAESIMTGPVAETAGAVAVAEAKETIAAAANAEAIEIVDQQRKPGISMVVVDAVADIVAVIAGKAKSSPRAPTRKRKYKTVNKLKGMVPPQGTVKLAQNKKIPQITAAMWMDCNPVHMLSSGGSGRLVTVDRRIHGFVQQSSAPVLVKDYHKWRGGVHVHDQLWMQRYSIQLGYKSRKYYRTLVFSLLVMELVNAFIVRRYHRRTSNRRPAKHFAFFEELMKQLLAVDTKEAFDEIAVHAETTLPSRQVDGIAEGHESHENPYTVNSEKGTKRRHLSCKVCALYKVKPRKFAKYYHPECSIGNKRKYLCNVELEGRACTCFRIRHAVWNNGNDIPTGLLDDHERREHPPASRPGKKRRRRREAVAESNDGERNVGDEVSDNESGNDGGTGV